MISVEHWMYYLVSYLGRYFIQLTLSWSPIVILYIRPYYPTFL